MPYAGEEIDCWLSGTADRLATLYFREDLGLMLAEK